MCIRDRENSVSAMIVTDDEQTKKLFEDNITMFEAGISDGEQRVRIDVALEHDISAKESKMSDNAVSYTHLDVYKRQEQRQSSQISSTSHGLTKSGWIREQQSQMLMYILHLWLYMSVIRAHG